MGMMFTRLEPKAPAYAATPGVQFTVEAPEFAESGKSMTVNIKMNVTGYTVSAFNLDLIYDKTLMRGISCTTNYKNKYELEMYVPFTAGETLSVNDIDYTCVDGALGVNQFSGATIEEQAASLAVAIGANLTKFNVTSNGAFIVFTQKTGGDGAMPTVYCAALNGIVGGVTNKNPDHDIDIDTQGTVKIIFTGNPDDMSTFISEGEELVYSVRFVVNNGKEGNTAFTVKNITMADENIHAIPDSTISVTNASTNLITNFSKDNTLKDLTVNGTTVSGFASATDVYSITVPYETSKVTLGATVNDETAKLESGVGEVSLNVGANELKVVVVAQNGGKKTYTINITREKCKDNNLSSIEVSGVTLVPAFNKDTLAYEMTVPYRTESVTISAAKNHETATLTGDGKKDLAVGSNTYEIKVTAQDGTPKTYTVKINRTAPSDDATLKSISIGDKAIEGFDPNVLEYNISKNFWTIEGNVSAVLSDPKSSLKLAGKNDLEVGKNTFTITVTAETGKTVTYTVNITREKHTDNGLKSLSVDGFALKPTFNKDEVNYTLTVPYKITELKVNAEVNHYTASHDCKGTYALNKEGTTVIEITVTAHNGTTKTYKITVTKAPASTDSKLKDLTFDGKTVSGFSKDKLEYSITVPYTQTSIKLGATVNEENARITSGTGSFDGLKVGENVYNIVVTAQDGKTVSTYTVKVNRTAAATNNNLMYIKVNNGTLSPEYDPNVTEYKVTVPYGVTDIKITYAMANEFATAALKGNGKLNVGENAFTIEVTAQSGAVKKYTVTVIRERCTDNTLKSITLSTGTLTPSFDPAVSSYIVQLPFTVDKIQLSCAANHSTATVSLDGGSVTAELKVGATIVEITVKAQNGTERKYEVTFVRAEPATNNSLGSMTVAGAELSPAFAPDVTEYSANVPYVFDKAEFSFTFQHETATAITSDNVNSGAVEVGENIYTIEVTAQNGDKKTYTVKLNRAEPSTNNKLSQIELSAGTMSPEFDPEVLEYTVDTAYADSVFTAMGILADELASVQNAENIELNVGENIVEIVVTAENGDVRVYKLNVIRKEPCSDSSLKSLVPSGGELTPAFAPDVTVYSVNVRYSIESMLFDCEANGLNATVEVTGEDTLVLGEANVFTVTVTAEDGSQTYYIVNVFREDKRNDSALSSLSVGGARFEFDPNLKTYDVTVPYGINVADISFTTNDEYASAVVDGDINLSEETANIFSVIVTAEDGSINVYMLSITHREIERDSFLLDINDSENLLEFIPGTLKYTITVPYRVEKISFEYEMSGKYSNAVMSGPDVLEAGVVNEYSIEVTAEDSSKTVYTIGVFRTSASDDASLKHLSVSGLNMEPVFDPNVLVYDIYVPYSATLPEIKYEVNHPTSIVNIYAPDSLVIGETVAQRVIVTAESGKVQTYVLRFFKDKISEDSTLSFLTPSAGELLPVFDPSVNNYTFNVHYGIEEIKLDYAPSHMASEIVFEGNEKLDIGENLFKITVTAENGNVSVYTLKVTRAEAETDTSLEQLEIKDAELVFDPSVKEYSIEVENFVLNAEFTWKAASEYATVVMTGEPALTEGETSTFIFTVTAQNGDVAEYKLNIFRRRLETDSTAKEIVIEGERLSLARGDTEFTVSVPYTTKEITIDATANSLRAKVEIKLPNSPLYIGKNTAKVVVTAEDGSVTEYTITVIRDAGSSNAYLKELVISNASLNEQFSKEKLNYTVTVPEDVDKLIVLAQADDEKASFEISDTALNYGENLITITVTSENGMSLQYKINVTREKNDPINNVKNDVVLTLFGIDFTIVGLAASAFGIAVILAAVIFIIIRATRKRE